MRFGLFIAVFASLMAVLAMTVPVPYGPPSLNGGHGPSAGSPARCLRLTYVYYADESGLPGKIRLRADASIGMDGSSRKALLSVL